MSNRIWLTEEPEGSPTREQRGPGAPRQLEGGIACHSTGRLGWNCREAVCSSSRQAGMCIQRLTPGLGWDESFGSLFPWKLQGEDACRKPGTNPYLVLCTWGGNPGGVKVTSMLWAGRRCFILTGIFNGWVSDTILFWKQVFSCPFVN